MSAARKTRIDLHVGVMGAGQDICVIPGVFAGTTFRDGMRPNAREMKWAIVYQDEPIRLIFHMIMNWAVSGSSRVKGN